MNKTIKNKPSLMISAFLKLSLIILIATLGFILLINNTKAVTSGELTLYFHKEASDVNETYGSLGLTPPEPAADTAPTTLTSTTNVNATPPTSFCESSDGQTDVQNERIASAASTGNRCLGTFISMPVGNAISMSTSDSATAITSQLWSSESATQAAVALNVYLYRCTTTCISTTTLTATDRIATLTCAEPGTTPTSCTASSAPANNITFAATDRIVAVVSSNVTTLRSGADTRFYFDSTGRTETKVTLLYTALGYNTSNKPSLTGTLDEDFTTAAATTACTTTGVTYHTKWTCLQGSAANTGGAFNAQDTAGAGSGDSSSWLWLRNQTTATGASPSNFGTTPSNTFLYQSMPNSYGDGTITTVVNSSATFGVGATTPTSPYNHIGLVLWLSNTDYLELQVYASGATTGTNTVNVALNNSGTVGTATSLNATTTSGIFGEIWLRFSNTAASWQAQYSTNGTTWNNVDSAVSHTAMFNRVGLNAFNKVNNPVSSYAGAFEWFQFNMPVTYNQTSYRIFANADSTTPGAALASQNTPYTLTSAGQEFRIRHLIKVGGQIRQASRSVSNTVDKFQIQYANMTAAGAGSCSAISNANYQNMYTNANVRNANTGVDDASIGSSTWGTPGNINLTDSSYATNTLSTAGPTHYLVATNFGFIIPATARVFGIGVIITGFGTNVKDNAVRLVKGGVIGSIDRSNTSAWPSTSTGLVYGGSSSDDWGDETLTGSDASSSNFGIALSLDLDSGTSGSASVDSIAMTLYYTDPASSGMVFVDNATASNFSNISSTGNDPTDTGQSVQPQSYMETPVFLNTQSDLGSSTDGMWDFVIKDNTGQAGKTYCFRMTKLGGTAFTTYTNYAQVTTYTPGSGPTTDQVMRGGNWFNSGTEQGFYWAQ